ncbi:MAG TPA: DUF3106 domain-containing protein [Phycisphaerae bacterium]|nr:DUF3106 domain-containing protein [Phycisphaerae bacterium]
MDDRRQELVRLLRRRRRVRLMAVCVAAALGCGAAAAILAPKVLVGGVPQGGPPAGRMCDSDAKRPGQGVLVGLSDRLDLDPREVRHNATRWRMLAPAEREAFFERYWRLAGLDVEDRDRLLARYEAFRSLPEDRQASLRRQARELRGFLADLSPQDQAVLAGAPEEQRAARLLELIERARGR